jgi:hypothetical protein
MAWKIASVILPIVLAFAAMKLLLWGGPDAKW